MKRLGSQRQAHDKGAASNPFFSGALLVFGALCGVTCFAQTPDPNQVHMALKEILSRPEFRPAPSSSENPILKDIKNYLHHLFSALGRFWHWLVRHFHLGNMGVSSVPRPMVYGLVVGLVLLGGWLLWRLVKSTVWSRLAKQKEKPSFSVTTEPDRAEVRPEAEALLQQAHRFAAAGDYRQAFRALFLAILCRLDQAQIIEYARDRTNVEYLRALRARRLDGFYEIMAPLARDFDKFWYGRFAAEEGDYRRGLSAYEKIVGLLGGASMRGGQGGTGSA
ncbi:Domain of unknown function (DUF4129) [Chthonomonas calidirosea]|uniref:DUF4129 domain-containing protein n=1 Tax=Chthonomonas calidirosea TaxID=454171 RepID=UPI0006DD3BD1|nr:DUF4129 domain-containing protein [Chthonomonas calidirosea]CEK19674.1 Domain of unknown function (DUF4129) [Chthonomonas calidirosea]